MRFGAFIPQGWRHDLVGIDREEQWPTIMRVAETIESSGFESLWVYDHFHPVPEPTQAPVHEAWTLMAALAATTDTVRLGQMCTSVAYREPSYLAKITASIDVISGGRLNLGIGAGWYEHEFKGYGYEFPKPSVRIGKLREGVEIVQRMWTEEIVDYQGKYYTLEGARCQPKPLQEPRIPLWIAGSGEQLTLRLVAEQADFSNFGRGIDRFRQKLDVLARHCREVGRDFDEITKSTNINTILIGENQAEVDEKASWLEHHFTPIVGAERAARMVEESSIGGGGVIGTPEQVVEQLGEYRDAGAEYLICYFQDAAYDLSSMELFAREVIPALA